MNEMIKIVTLCSGYDSQCLALDELKKRHEDFDYELIAWSEINGAAIAAHNILYPQWADRNKGDMKTIDWSGVPDFDVLFYSTPCQDFSLSGKGKGGVEGSGTRSSLLWYTRNAVIAKKPTYLIMENVDAILSSNHFPTFNKWLKELESYGYSSFYKVLNAKDYGVPQDRKRCIVVSILCPDRPFDFGNPKIACNPLDIIDDEWYSKTEAYDFDYQCIVDGVDKYEFFESLCYENGAKTIGDDTYTVRLSQNKAFNTITCHTNNVADCLMYGKRYPQPCIVRYHDGDVSIRNLSPNERYKLMGVRERERQKLLSLNSGQSFHYNLAGNSIVVDVLVDVFERLLYGNYNSLY